MQLKAIFLSLVFFLSLAVLWAQNNWNAEVVPPVLQTHFENSPEEYQAVWLYLGEQVDVLSLDQGFYEQQFTRKQRVATLLPLLQEKARTTQVALLQYLQGLSGVETGSVESLWIANAIFCRANIQALKALSFRTELALISPDPEQNSDAVPGAMAAPLSQGGHERQHDTIRAPFMWQMGYSGYGASVLIIDSGVDVQHPSLAHNYKGKVVAGSQAWFDINDNTSIPFDCGQHGTHVAGIAVGLDPTNQDTIGVAPGATWLGSPAIRGGSCSNGQFPVQALQWALNPDGDPSTVRDMPSVINNSYGTSYEDISVAFCNGIYRQVFNSLEAAGIAVVFAAGNDGAQGLSTVNGQSHINTGLVNSFAVGSVNSSNFLNGFSSKGPSICGGSGSLKKKPEVVAPGSGIRSAQSGGTGYFNQSGTSMAAPVVSGALLLLQEAFPQLTGTELKLAIYFSARDLGPNGEDDSFGMGLIDLSAAYQYLLNQGHSPALPSDNNDVRLSGIFNLEPEMCETTVAPILQIENLGTEAFTQLKIDYRYNDSLSGQFIWNGSLAVGANTGISLPLESIPTGGYTLEVNISEINGSSDYHYLDNEKAFDFSIVADSIQALSNEPICQGESGMLSVLTTGTGTVIWYDDSVGGNEIATGSAWVTPPLQNDTTVYATIEYRRESGKKTYVGDDGIFDTGTENALIFDAYTPFRLKSVLVLSQADGQRLIELRDAGGTVLASKAVAINLGPRLVELDFDVPAGRNMQLGIAGSSNLFVSSSKVYYPYGISQVLQIKRSLADGNGEAFYPYYYDWQIEYPGTCERVPVQAMVAPGTAQAAFSANLLQLVLPDTASVQFTDQSQGATSWFWNFGDGDTSSQQNPMHIYTYTGTFPVGLSVMGSDGCRVATSQTVNVGGINTSIDLPSREKALRLFPNPTEEVLFVQWTGELPGKAQLQVFDMQGKLVWRENISPQAHGQSELSTQNWSPGVYLVRISSSAGNWQEKVLKR